MEESKETISFCIKEEETDPTDMTIFDIAMDLSHIHNNVDYTTFIHEASMFYHQLKLHGMGNSFKKLYEELHLIWDEYGIPYNKRRKLLLVEIEIISLLMCD